ncbi:uncharacterized protein FFB20_02592 [Fusarium fujikuroi]|uniref:Uncharacterized protein n=2 Tax=Fusarium fujikuroi TaxID=5127 RepID=S0EC72_GIBF5|nr:uncharacterized protein FFUJ_05918 [Fusarium fujikuroi IMI 58289]KLO84301.1 uncharacterized protein LW93_1093 [Fusarium fujikuroi]KLP09653.1 uncharacterized protein Y057_5167 [Fusarium fujikuroi]KLP22293.1 uncharacterized protein LW94_10249 [Fusarium fujikuroi]QGI65830.1 hypothetical protein CEK27_009801 [Fusarium fujikuroi]QGI83071.1 hypothetical protein CEK25_009800 [Fusarium fujikuroi]
MAVRHVGDMFSPMHSFCGPRRDKAHGVRGPTKDPNSLSNFAVAFATPHGYLTMYVGNVTGKEVGKSLVKNNEEHAQCRSCDVVKRNSNSHKSS